MRDLRSMFVAATSVCLLAMTGTTAGAQGAQTAPPPAPSGPLTLEQVLGLAEPRSEAIQIAEAGVRRADGDVIRARSGLLPQLSAAASYDRALASEFAGLFDTASFGGSTNLSNLPFGRVNTFRAGLSFSQNVYTGGRITAQRQVAVVGRESADLAL